MKQLHLTAREYAALRQGAEKRKPRRRKAAPAPTLEITGDGVTSRGWKVWRVPLTANGALRSHWARRRRDRQDWARIFLAGGPPPREPPRKALVHVHVWRTRRLQDPDNRVASVKLLIDALVARGWLYDDSEEHLDLHVLEMEGLHGCTLVQWYAVEAPR